MEDEEGRVRTWFGLMMMLLPEPPGWTTGGCRRLTLALALEPEDDAAAFLLPELDAMYYVLYSPWAQ